MNAKKQTVVKNLSDKLSKAKTLILADYTGLNVAKISELRARIKKSGGDFEVAKNTLLLKATTSANSLFHIPASELIGPTSCLWLYEEDPTPIKVLVEFAKQGAIGAPKIKFGFWNKELIDEAKILQLASLPSRQELYAKLVGNLNKPIYGLVYSLKWNLDKLAYVLTAIVNSKQ